MILGIAMCIIPEEFIFYAVGAVLILVTAFFACATVRRLIKDNWNLNKNIVYALLTIFLTAVTLITFIKEGALFVMASAIFERLCSLKLITVLTGLKRITGSSGGYS